MSGKRADLSFPRTARIRARRDYTRIQGTGSRAPGRHLILLYTENGLSFSRFGITVSRKTGNAVTRNRIKRKLREIQRLNRPRIAPGFDMVVIARRRAAVAGFGDLEREFLELAAASGLLAAEVST